ncbi:MAG: porphobilinogen synthase [Candidatus Omnitrophica bacterium]|nr:porphobilinogen synthase [Candidatus Omnitrophota bacterium]
MPSSNNRARRLRHTPAIRALTAETRLHAADFVQPYFVIEGKNKKESIPSMPGISRYSSDLILDGVERFIKKGGRAGLFFGVIDKKDLQAKKAVDPEGVIPQTVRKIKKAFPDFCVVTDVCLCGYTSHGHCGILKNDYVDNDASVKVLTKMALQHALAGADIVAPSDMMDFRVRAIRESLDQEGFVNTLIMSYAAKYCSAFYGPFRDAAHSAPRFGDRRTYQMNPANTDEAIKEVLADLEEGADLVMVKPALSYLDVIHRVKKAVNVPVAAYNVSGEYSMVKAAARKKWIDERAIVLETLTSIKRAGADIIISYHSEDALKWINPR